MGLTYVCPSIKQPFSLAQVGASPRPIILKPSLALVASYIRWRLTEPDLAAAAAITAETRGGTV